MKKSPHQPRIRETLRAAFGRAIRVVQSPAALALTALIALTHPVVAQPTVGLLPGQRFPRRPLSDFQQVRVNIFPDGRRFFPCAGQANRRGRPYRTQKFPSVHKDRTALRRRRLPRLLHYLQVRSRPNQDLSASEVPRALGPRSLDVACPARKDSARSDRRQFDFEVLFRRQPTTHGRLRAANVYLFFLSA